MATLLEQYKQKKEKESQETLLASKIKELAEKPYVINLLKVGLLEEFVGQIKSDSGPIVTLEPIKTSKLSGYDSYQLIIETKVTEVDVKAHININGRVVAVKVIEYNENLLTTEKVAQLFKEVIGVEDKVKNVK